MATAENNNKIILKSNDDKCFEVDRSVISLSKTLNNMFQSLLYLLPQIYSFLTLFLDLGMDQENSADYMMAEPIKLPNIKGTILRKVQTDENINYKTMVPF